MPGQAPEEPESPQPVVKIAGGLTDKVRSVAEFTPGKFPKELAAELLSKPVIQAGGRPIFIVIFNLIVIISEQAVYKPGIDPVLPTELVGGIQPGPVAVIGFPASSDGGVAGFCHPATLGGNAILGNGIFGSQEIVCELKAGGPRGSVVLIKLFVTSNRVALDGEIQARKSDRSPQSLNSSNSW